jgi:pseudouridine-5'-phosphate glycosidase
MPDSVTLPLPSAVISPPSSADLEKISEAAVVVNVGGVKSIWKLFSSP